MPDTTLHTRHVYWFRPPNHRTSPAGDAAGAFEQRLLASGFIPLRPDVFHAHMDAASRYATKGSKLIRFYEGWAFIDQEIHETLGLDPCADIPAYESGTFEEPPETLNS